MLEKKENIFLLKEKIGKNVYKKLVPLKIEAWITMEPMKWNNKMSGENRVLELGDAWGDIFDCAWMKLSAVIPEYNESKQLVLLVDIGGEGLVFDETGKVIRGITNKTSSYGIPPDKPGKWVVEIEEKKTGDFIEFWIDAGCNDLFGYVQNGGIITDAHIGICDNELKDLYYDIEIFSDWLEGENGFQSHQPQGVHNIEISKSINKDKEIRELLIELDKILLNLTNENIRKAKELLNQKYYKKSKNNDFNISAIGHAHLDIAWTWPVREGRRKAARTFATAVKNMETYPDYIFGASQYQLFEWVKEDYPELFDKIKKYVDEKRFELQGCFWVEADLNISGGEALIRQILYGLKYLKEEFNTTVNNLWEPDVFGFTGALPQILLKSGIKYIGSQKLSQNEINKFPHHLFRWKGIDDSELIMHNFPEDTYDGRARASSSLKIEANYIEKDIVPEALMVYGVGDGGGGPGEEHLERLKRISNLDGLPKIKQKRACDYFEDIEKYRDKLPVLNGELYFEKHQGTFTSESLNKKYNKLMEESLRELEFYCVLASKIDKYEYPKEKLDKIWKEVLLYQFHDILPGSSIGRVYKESLKRYDVLLNEVRELIENAQLVIEEKIDTRAFRKPHVLYNNSSWVRDEWVKIAKKWQRVKVPAMGYKVIELEECKKEFSCFAEDKRIENNYLKIEFDDNGGIKSIYDKELNYEFIPENDLANIITIYHERAAMYPAWDFAQGYRDRRQAKAKLIEMKLVVDGAKVAAKQIYKYKNSQIIQEISLIEDSKRIDFKTKINWKETDTSVKAKFPITIKSETAMCGIQFGAIARPTQDKTTLDFAKDEIPAQRWVDISENNRGIAILSDYKYGYRVKEQALEITLLRSQKKPGAEFLDKNDLNYISLHYGDICEQEFTYSIFPHKGNFSEGKVVKEAYSLSTPLSIRKLALVKGVFSHSNSYFNVNKENIVIETIKKSEDGKGIIIRVYETTGIETNFILNSSFNFEKALIVNLMEEKERSINMLNNSISLSAKAFEILTIKLL